MSHYFSRPTLAASMARQLIHPDVLSEGLRSGLFISGQRRTGKTTFLHNDLIPALEQQVDVDDHVGHFLFIGTGSHRAMVGELTARRTQAFNGAHAIPYQVLDADYVADLLARLNRDGAPNVPSHDATLAAFRMVGHRPEELMKALRQVQLHTPAGDKPDRYLPAVTATLRAAIADIELAKVEQLGLLATAIFEKVAATDGDATGVFSAEAAAGYGKLLGREVKVEEIQPLVNELVAANILMRRGHGLYGVADPAVQETWRERRQLLG
jgi:hypothetical protein